MTERERLLAAVCETPDDDAPRLVYADWLEEYGDEAEQARAEFIRVQVALARMGDYDPARPALLAREQELLEARILEWIAEAPPGLQSPEMRRGFIGHASMEEEAFLRLPESVWQHIPLSSVELEKAGDYKALSAHAG